MTRRGRLGLLGVSLVVALMVTVQAFAAINPTLDATTQASGTTITYAQGTGDDPPAAITFYVAKDYAALLSQSEGDKIGTAAGTAIAGDLGGATLKLSGDITVALGTTTISFAGATVPISALSVQCTGTPTHSAFWILNLSASGQTLQVPAFVDDIPLTNPLSSTANNRIQICLPPPDVPAGTPGRASLGARVVSATLTLTEVFSAAPGWYLWHVIVTPYNPGRGTPNVAGTISAQSYDRTPQALTATAKAGADGKATVRGRVTAGFRGVAGATVTIKNGDQEVGTAKTTPGGRFKATIDAAAGDELVATAVAPVGKAKCQQGWFPVNCVSAQFPSFTVTSDPFAVS
ncbi:MAG: hypothetical protein FJW96_01880 [Actinobacteria bacterium]|nr:hypothetical protein [Actinomycetota bacterium]